MTGWPHFCCGLLLVRSIALFRLDERQRDARSTPGRINNGRCRITIYKRGTVSAQTHIKQRLMRVTGLAFWTARPLLANITSTTLSGGDCRIP